MPKDTFANQGSSLTSPFTHGDAVVPSDTVDLPYVTRAIYIGTPGDIRVTTVGDTIITLRNHPVGYLPGRVTRVHQSGTTASQIVALW
jgi:hypothetical protein